MQHSGRVYPDDDQAWGTDTRSYDPRQYPAGMTEEQQFRAMQTIQSQMIQMMMGPGGQITRLLQLGARAPVLVPNTQLSTVLNQVTELTLNQSTQSVFLQMHTGPAIHALIPNSAVSPLQLIDVIPPKMDKMLLDGGASAGASANATDAMMRSRVSRSQGLDPVLMEGVDPEWKDLILRRKEWS